jgi:hypothetical protein
VRTVGTTEGEEGRIHELLPWFATGRLSEEEVVAFRDHLPACADCREELAVIEKIRGQLELHGEAFVEEHPSAELLVAVTKGEHDDEGQAARVRRHLALCDACARESRWVAGEAQVAGASARPPVRWAAWAALAAAAAVVGALILFPPWRGAPGPAVRIASAAFIRPAERLEASTENVVRLPEGASGVGLIFEVDFSPASFPVRLELKDEHGRLLHVEDPVAREALVEGTYLFLDCDRNVCAPGSYLVEIHPRGGSEPQQGLRFEVVGR